MKTQKQYLSEVKERVEKATPGDWNSEFDGFSTYPDPEGTPYRRLFITTKGEVDLIISDADADFIEHAKKDIEAMAQIIEIHQKAIQAFEKFASHKTGGLERIEFFRYLARNAREQNRASVETGVWDTVADALEALEFMPEGV